MSAAAVLVRVRALGVTLSASGERLRYEAPAGVLTPDLLAELRAHKAELLALLAALAEEYEERAGILEHDAVLPKAEAERRAFDLVYCRDCRRFTPDPINPAAAIGSCAIGWSLHGRHGPMGTAPPAVSACSALLHGVAEALTMVGGRVKSSALSPGNRGPSFIFINRNIPGTN